MSTQTLQPDDPAAKPYEDIRKANEQRPAAASSNDQPSAAGTETEKE